MRIGIYRVKAKPLMVNLVLWFLILVGLVRLLGVLGYQTWDSGTQGTAALPPILIWGGLSTAPSMALDRMGLQLRYLYEED